MGSAYDPRNPPTAPENYRAEAEYCRQQAEQAGEVLGIREKYLDLAEKWTAWRDKRRELTGENWANSHACLSQVHLGCA